MKKTSDKCKVKVLFRRRAAIEPITVETNNDHCIPRNYRKEQVPTP